MPRPPHSSSLQVASEKHSLRQESEESLIEVLFIGDDSAIDEMYRMKLQLDGYRVRMIRRLEEWQAQPAVPRPDIVFLHIDMGGSARLAEYTRLRAHPILKDVPAVLLAAAHPQHLREQGLTLCARDYVVTIALPVDLRWPASERKWAARWRAR